MKNRKEKQFDNLLDSIVWLGVCLVCHAIFLIGLYCASIGSPDTSLKLFVVLICLFFPSCICCIVLLVKGCFGYWYIDNTSISSKKLLRKSVTIAYNEIVCVEKKIVPAMIIATYSSMAYIIKAKKKQIVILTERNKNIATLEEKLHRFNIEFL